MFESAWTLPKKRQKVEGIQNVLFSLKATRMTGNDLIEVKQFDAEWKSV